MLLGHSLGAGLGQILALHLAERYGIETSCGLQIDGTFFAPPRIFDSEGVERFRALVNGRVLYDDADGLAYIPCYDGNSEQGWRRCGRDNFFVPGVGRDFYAENYGLVEIHTDFLKQSGGLGVSTIMKWLFPENYEDRGLPDLLGRIVSFAFPTLNSIPSLGTFGAAHVCSFACKFGKAGCGSRFSWWCSNCPMLL